MFKLIVLVMTLTVYSIQAEVRPELKNFQCKSEDEMLSVEGVAKSSCQDNRYTGWQRNGCYDIVVKNHASNETFSYEMVRNLSFVLEERQGFYSMYTYDEKEWVLQGFIVEFEGTDGRDLPRMRFDTREKHPDAFVSTWGNCTIAHE